MLHQRRPQTSPPDLLDLGGAAGLFDLLEQALGLLTLDALLDGAGGIVHDGLGLLEAESGGGAHDLDHADLLLSGASQDEINRPGLLLRRGAVPAAAGRRCRRHGGRRDTELLLERLDALGELEHGDVLELVVPILRTCCHQLSFSLFSSESSEVCSEVCSAGSSEPPSVAGSSPMS